MLQSAMPACLLKSDHLMAATKKIHVHMGQLAEQACINMAMCVKMLCRALCHRKCLL